MSVDKKRQLHSDEESSASTSDGDTGDVELIIESKRPKKEKTKSSFKDFMLRRIVKEFHNESIKKLCFNTNHAKGSKIFVSIGSQKANIYDNDNKCNRFEGANMEGSHIDIMMQWPGVEGTMVADHYKQSQTEKEKRTTACCWVKEKLGDSLLALGNDAGMVVVVSMSDVKALAMLEGHRGRILDMVASPTTPGVLATISKDDRVVRIWHVDAEGGVCCLATFELAGACVLAISPDGSVLLVGCKDGKVYSIDIPKDTNKKQSQLHPTLLGKHHSNQLDTISYVSSDRVVSKSKDGHIILWDPTKSGKNAVVLHITNPRKLTSTADWCPFSLSGDGLYVCVGNSDGEVLIYSLTSGEMQARLKHPKLKKILITACAFAEGSDQVLCATEKGYIFRYDYIAPEIKAAWDAVSAGPGNDSGDSSSDEK